MNLRNRRNLVSRVIGLVGVVASGTAIALPLEAKADNHTAPITQLPGAVEELPAAVPAVQPPALIDAQPPVEMPAAEMPAAPEALTIEAAEPAPAELPAAEIPEVPAAEMPAASEASEMAPVDMPETAAPEAEAAEPMSAPETAANSATIVDIASASDTFTTLVAALTEAELVEVLQGEGPFTVFAPTDAAFEALPAGTVEELLKPENRDRLVQILTYHVVPGSVTSDSLTSGEVATVEGSTVDVVVDGSKVTVNEATVIQPDVMASNGVIHVIDRVILPPTE